jgi:hypothetical protein
MTYHWLQFRAQGPTAKLTVSDWAKPDALGGPVGQEIIYSFVEVQPVLERLSLARNQLTESPDAIGQLPGLLSLNLEGNQLTELPLSLTRLENLVTLNLDGNPLNPALAAAYEGGVAGVMAYVNNLDG